jgi:hypothetical protein
VTRSWSLYSAAGPAGSSSSSEPSESELSSSEPEEEASAAGGRAGQHSKTECETEDECGGECLPPYSCLALRTLAAACSRRSARICPSEETLSGYEPSDVQLGMCCRAYLSPVLQMFLPLALDRLVARSRLALLLALAEPSQELPDSPNNQPISSLSSSIHLPATDPSRRGALTFGCRRPRRPP